MSVRFNHLSKAELDRQLSPSVTAKDFAGVLARNEAATAKLWSMPELSTDRDLAYGRAPRAKLDIVRPAGDGPFPTFAFVHGGFWQEGSKAGSGFSAMALVRSGWASVLIGYTLAPEAQLTSIVKEIDEAVTYLAANASSLRLDPRRLVLAGHSAGGHMAAALICGKANTAAAGLVAGAVLASGVYDLAPIAASYVNDKVGISAAEIAELSLLDSVPLRDIPVHILVGKDEPDAFLAQSRALDEAWRGKKGPTSFRLAPGRDHFDVLDELSDTASPSFAAILEMGA